VTVNDESRRGLLGHGSLLTVTSYPNRTSPVLRGKWLLDNILGTPPPPPPDDVPPLSEGRTDGVVVSVRERLEQHRKNPTCASCHAPMDPLGFALESFDGIGRLRTHERGQADAVSTWRLSDVYPPVDATGTLPDGSQFEGPAGLRNVLLDRREQFVGTLTEKLLTYALGRGLEYYDQPAVRHIIRDAASSEYRWSSLVVGIVRSVPFQMRKQS
jgi:hypothetical protein